MKTFLIEEQDQQPDGMGGYKNTEWDTFVEVTAILDMQSGTRYNAGNNAVIEDSTHVLVILDFTPGITSDMRVKDPTTGRIYEILHPDDPVGLGHHNELYLRYDAAEKAAVDNG